jgi:O-antigen/teichoic acid export membrane protein
VSVAGQLISATDLIVVGAVATPAAVAFYRAAWIVPSQATALLFIGYDTVYPLLAGTTDMGGQEIATRFLTRVVAFVAGAMFAVLIVLRVDVVVAVTGHSSALAESVLVVFCCIWMANVPVHGLSLLLIARGRQNVFIWLVGVEAAANLVLTMVFAVVMGPIGAAYATLGTIALSNVFVFPAIVRHEFSKGVAATAALATSPTLEFGVGWVRLISGLILGGGFSCAFGLLLLRQGGRSLLVSMIRGPSAAQPPR